MSANGKIVRATVEGYGTLCLRQAPRQVPRQTANYEMVFHASLLAGKVATIEDAIHGLEASKKVRSVTNRGDKSSVSITVVIDTRGQRNRSKFAGEYASDVIKLWEGKTQNIAEHAPAAAKHSNPRAGVHAR